MHTRLLLVAALATTLLPAQNQTQGQEQLAQQRAEKLAKEVFAKQPWIVDFDKARETAKKEGKLVLGYFTRSDAH